MKSVAEKEAIVVVPVVVAPVGVQVPLLAVPVHVGHVAVNRDRGRILCTASSAPLPFDSDYQDRCSPGCI